MSFVVLALPLGQESVAEEGRRIIIVMLLVGLIFLAVIALGQLTRWWAHRRRHRRAARLRAY